MTNSESIWEMRRRADGWFISRAGNAMHCAELLWESQETTPNIAYYEGYLREAALALELTVKAVICIRTNKPPKATHDIYDLWNQAELPKLSSDEKLRLTEFTEILCWSGRYGAPTRDNNLEKAKSRRDAHQTRTPFGNTYLLQDISLDWIHFQKLIKYAMDRYWQLKNEKDHF